MKSKQVHHHMQKAMHHMAQAHKHHASHEIETGEPKGYDTHAEMRGDASKADTSGERKEKLIHHMVADAKENKPMSKHEDLSGGRHDDGHCYVHERSSYQ